MIAVSTAWKSANAESVDDILIPIRECGFEVIELEYRITAKMFRDMLPSLRRGQPKVSSVHNFFPLPEGLARDGASGDLFSLSSPDREERERAVKYTLRTLEHAHEVGARGVVLHLGKIDMDNGFSQLREAYEKGIKDGSMRNYVKELFAERTRRSSKYLEGALFSMDRLWRTAERFELRLGIENRFYLNEVPSVEEIGSILEKFEGSPIGYWHDVGHAEVQQRLYGISQRELLERFSRHLVGVHLHDVDNVKDHLAPGKGSVDFDMIRKYVNRDAIHVIELSPDVSEEDLRDSIGFLSEKEYLSL